MAAMAWQDLLAMAAMARVVAMAVMAQKNKHISWTQKSIAQLPKGLLAYDNEPHNNAT